MSGCSVPVPVFVGLRWWVRCSLVTALLAEGTLSLLSLLLVLRLVQHVVVAAQGRVPRRGPHTIGGAGGSASDDGVNRKARVASCRIVIIDRAHAASCCQCATAAVEARGHPRHQDWHRSYGVFRAAATSAHTAAVTVRCV